MARPLRGRGHPQDCPSRSTGAGSNGSCGRFSRLLLFLFQLTGNFGVAIIGLTLIVRLIMFPIAQKQFQSMAAMRKIQPKMKAIQERFKDDKQRQQQEILKLYQTEKINPAAGCLPILLQIPVFYALYKVLMVQRRNAPPAVHPVDQGLERARPADPGQPVRPARLHAAALPGHRRAADPGRLDPVAVDEAQPAADGPGAAADLRDHAVGAGVRHGAVRGGPAALLDDQQRPHHRAAMVAVPPLRAALSATPTRSRHERDAGRRRSELTERARKLFAGPIAFLKSAPELQVPARSRRFRKSPSPAARTSARARFSTRSPTATSWRARRTRRAGRRSSISSTSASRSQLRLVDMPGYGFAEAPKDMVKRWRFLINDYLRGRAVLKRALVLVDSRHGLKPVDRDIMNMLDDAAVNYQLVLTKADKVKPTELAETLAAVEAEAAQASRRASRHLHHIERNRQPASPSLRTAILDAAFA